MLQRHGYLSLGSGLVDPSNRAKVLGINLATINDINGNAPQILTIPPGNTTMVGTDLNQDLTNKSITNFNNNVAANSLKTSSGSYVDITPSTPSGAGQVLTTTSRTSATWQTNSLANVTFYSSTGPVQSGFTVYRGRYSENSFLSGYVTVYPTVNGTSSGQKIFTDIANAHIICSVGRGSTFSFGTSATVRSINTNTHAITFYVGNVGTIYFGTDLVLWYTVSGY